MPRLPMTFLAISAYPAQAFPKHRPSLVSHTPFLLILVHFIVSFLSLILISLSFSHLRHSLAFTFIRHLVIFFHLFASHSSRFFLFYIHFFVFFLLFFIVIFLFLLFFLRVFDFRYV